MIVDLTDEQARAALPCKWGAVEPGVLPGWVAEMDYALAPPIVEAVTGAVGRGTAGYPPFGDASANLNLVLDQGPSDPVSGSSPLRASLCELRRL